MITINNIIYHIFSKEVHQSGVLHINPKVSDPTDNHHEFLGLLTEKYAKQAGKGFGKFGDNSDIYQMPKILNDYLGDGQFYDFSLRLMNILKAESDKKSLAKGGKVFIADYNEDQTRYILITILNDHTTFNATDWLFTKTESLDLNRLRYAGRINLDKWQADESRYISFLKGKESDVSDYFKYFLGCDDAVIARTETTKLLELLDTFIRSNGWDIDQAKAVKERAHDYLKGLSDRNFEFNSESFANYLSFDDPQSLIDILSHQNSGVSDGFVPDGRIIRRLYTYAAKTKHWKISFDNEAIISGDIGFENGRIILNNPPAELLEAFDLS